ncbi:hypothetical protein TREMEDRAFT_68819 [Tremella mesenterica DSM 1558]|uniref:uncharacterized protein n=1 Tax=Tremella mesenterica (strain ATCC 24925 / CBS 8224 / DSM 1558 / NBRC 9311 / NRRL Y-6157 / RJB 2259-6 / UBC 559-6) TaxID=578456 RepID=UPI0003F49AC1|nr:uncharacterized protein TREMEDRAFT_68819 [Tremella mesenterica DSM 1558]EIW69692.1 hypothetical protein TREMEDRAFT_68819 [Tremella mesenterica DSM 1558]
MAPTLSSAITISAVGLFFKALIRARSTSFEVRNLPILLDALNKSDTPSIVGPTPVVDPSNARTHSGGTNITERADGDRRMVIGEREKVGMVDVDVGAERFGKGEGRRRGLVTVCNHNSVLDDPGMWALMPLSNYFPLSSPKWTSQHTRWTLGASDIMFTNSFFSKFFTLGQVIETYRGGGVFQPAVDQAVKLLQSGEWVHIFPEGRVNQQSINPSGGLFRFKWGVGRIIMDSTTLPEIIPMWVSRFDTVMPETRTWPRLFPRKGGKLSVTIGQPITHLIRPLVEEWQNVSRSSSGPLGIGGDWNREKGLMAGGREQEIRIRITAILQEQVEKLGREVERLEGRFESGEWSHSTSRRSS